LLTSTHSYEEKPLKLFLSTQRGRAIVMSERINTAIDVTVLSVGFFLTSWFYYELYQAFRIYYLGF